MWKSKIGMTGKPLLLGLSDTNGLYDFGSLLGPGGVGVPQLRIRRRNRPSSTALSFDVVEYEDLDNDPPLYNAQVFFTFDELTAPGFYVAEVDASIGGFELSFPDDGHIEIQFLAGVEE